MPKPKLAVTLICGLIAIMLMGADDSCSTEEPTITEGPGKASGDGNGAGSGESGAAVAKVGDRVTLKGTTYRVTGARTSKTVGSGYMKEDANGTFVIVDLQLTNEKDEPSTILESAIKLAGGNGKQYSSSTDAAFALGDAFILLEEIQPDLTVEGTIAYDVPPDAVRGSRLLVTDLFSDSTGEIDLGLR